MRLILLLLFLPDILVAHYRDRLHCPSTQEFSGELLSGEFKSPNFPISYINNLNCVYVIHPYENSGIALNIEHFELEDTHDTVEIFQTYNVEGNLQSTKHATLSGSMIATTQFFSQMEGGFRIVFKTDFSENHYAGFKMSFQRFYAVNSPGFNPCPQIFHESKSESVTLPVPQWNRSPPRMSCVFQINSTESTRLTLNSLKSYVRIDVYETENFLANRGSTILASYTPYTVKSYPKEVDSRTKSLTVVVTYTSSIANFSNAYNMSIHQIQNPCKCPDQSISLNYTEVYYNSPGWPDEYCDNLDCQTSFKVDRSATPKSDHFQCVLLEFYDFDVEANHDLFELYSGDRKLKLLTPHDENPPNRIAYFTFPSTNAVIKFKTDMSITASGYQLGVRIYDQPKKCRCPTQASSSAIKDSIIQDFAAECGYLDCFWTLMPPDSAEARYRIVLTSWYNIGSWGEFIEVSNDQEIGPNLNTIRFTASMRTPNETLYGKVISMHSDKPIQIWYHREDQNPAQSPNPNDRRLKFEYSWEERCGCGPLELTATTDKWTEINSPDFPAPYCDGMNCTYTITGPEDSIILLNVSDVDLEFNMDFLFFFEGHKTNESRIGAYTGIDYTSDPIESSSNVVTMMFTSDLSVAGKGYKVHYKAKKPKQDYGSGGGFSVFKVFLFLAFASTVVVGGVYVFKRYRPEIDNLLPSFQLQNLNNPFSNAVNNMFSRRNFQNENFIETD